jgi:hypothetical protein
MNQASAPIIWRARLKRPSHSSLTPDTTVYAEHLPLDGKGSNKFKH